MESENLKRKLSLFYHPLFQTIVQEWFLTFQIPHNSMDLLSFLEINLKIQKVILSELEIDDSLSSALTDWVREIASLSQKGSDPSKQEATKDNNSSLPITKNVRKMLKEIPFPAALSEDIYCQFLETQTARLDSSLLVDKLSLHGFAKFLFDLCYSWCEDLDIELFTMFLLGVLYLSSEFKGGAGSLPQSKALSDISSFPEVLLTQIKLLKAHYQKYKKVDLRSYEKFYEWNYLPNRLKEIKARMVEAFKCFVGEKDNITAHIESIYQASMLQITQKELVKPTTIHFTVYPKPQEKTQEKNANNKEIRGPHASINYDNCPEIAEMGKNQKLLAKPYTTRVIKKLNADDGEVEEPVRVHTVNTLDPFIDENEEPGSPNTALVKKPQLFPIWETSEMGSLVATQVFDKPLLDEIEKAIEEENLMNDILLNKDDPSRQKKKEKILRLNKMQPRERMKPIEELLVKSPSNLAGKIPVKEGRTSVSPKLLQQRRRNQPQTSPDKMQEEFKIEAKLNMLLSDRQEGRTQTPGGYRTHRRIVLSPSNIGNSTSNEVGKESVPRRRVIKYFGTTIETVIKPNSAANKSKSRPKLKETSFESPRQKSQLRLIRKNMNGTTVRSNEQSLEEEVSLYSTQKSGKYCLDFQPIQKEEAAEGEKEDRSDKKRKEKLRFLAFGKTSRVNFSPRLGIEDNNISNNSLIKDKKNMTLEEIRLEHESPFVDKYAMLAKLMREESYNGQGNGQQVKVELPKALSTKSGFLNMKKALTEYVSKMDSKEPVNDKVKTKVEKNKKNQEVRMKLVTKPDTNTKKIMKNNLLGLDQLERKKLENTLMNDMINNQTNNAE